MPSTPSTEAGLGGAGSTSIVAASISFLGSYWFVLLPALFVTRLLYRRYAMPMSKYPGPALASVSRLWKVISTASGRTNLQHIDLHRKYGPIVRIAPNEQDQVLRRVPPPENPDIFTEVREHVHAQKKKVANVPYSMAAMQQLSPFIDESIELFMSKLDGFATSSQSATKGRVDLGAWLHYFAFDVLGEVAFGRKFGFLEEGRDVEGAIKTIDDSQWYNGIIGQIPEFDHLFRRNPLRKYIPGMSTGNALVTRLALAEMDRRQPFTKDNMGKNRVGDGRQDLLASLIQGHLKDPSKFSEGDVFAVAHGAIFAGSDSTASTMQSFFWHALADARVRRILFEEIRAAVAEGRVPIDGNLSWVESQSLSYFQACLKEAMRVRPAVGLNITRVVPPRAWSLMVNFTLLAQSSL
ncbi:unnamed protein product [Parascedosporium putredinis]|uniref:Uncharacterized protein n=1 Tax=Parascedosporium putredinis TaxID=1442378 RepID=A0A9P1M898_9PEZI|nr:unnamed protein product [Parascedosporium putredinis]CAI7992231.1 unnamed protein product [Parascedosporium putredinis]